MLARRNAILVLMSVELMLNAVNLNLVAFDVWLRDELLAGQVFTLFVITIAAAEVGLGLAIVLLVFRNRETAELDQLRRPARPEPAPGAPDVDEPVLVTAGLRRRRSRRSSRPSSASSSAGAGRALVGAGRGHRQRAVAARRRAVLGGAGDHRRAAA